MSSKLDFSSQPSKRKPRPSHPAPYTQTNSKTNLKSFRFTSYIHLTVEWKVCWCFEFGWMIDAPPLGRSFPTANKPLSFHWFWISCVEGSGKWPATAQLDSSIDSAIYLRTLFNPSDESGRSFLSEASPLTCTLHKHRSQRNERRSTWGVHLQSRNGCMRRKVFLFFVSLDEKSILFNNSVAAFPSSPVMFPPNVSKWFFFYSPWWLLKRKSMTWKWLY